MSGPAYVGLDLGTSSLKGLVLSAGGEVLARASAGYPTSRPAPGRAEQDPGDWASAAASVLAELSARVSVDGWEAVGLSGMIPTLVLEDADGGPLGPALTWEDDRAQAEGDAFRAEHGEAALLEATGQRVDGRYLLPMLRWVRRAEPERAAHAARVLSAKDHLFRWLTGEAATDPSTATGFGCFDLDRGAWAEGLAGRAAALLPEVRPSTSSAPLRAGAAEDLGLREGLPVCLGAADSVAGALGLGARDPGDCAYLAGTSTVILGVHDRRVEGSAPFLTTPLALGHGWGLEMDLVSTGSAIAWAGALLGLAEGEVLTLAERSEPGARGVTFLPYLGRGEQGALWDPDLRGALVGLTLAHDRADVARALLEGVALESRRCLDVLDEVGVAPTVIRAAGPVFGSGPFAGLLAGATGRPVAVSDEPSVSARGAAQLAAASVGAELGPGEGPAAEAVRPDPASASRWSDLWARHERARAGSRSSQPGE